MPRVYREAMDGFMYISQVTRSIANAHESWPDTHKIPKKSLDGDPQGYGVPQASTYNRADLADGLSAKVIRCIFLIQLVTEEYIFT